MRPRELRRLKIIHEVMDKKITQEKAGELEGLSNRQIRRIIKRVRKEGDTGIVHRSRGKESNRKIPKKIKTRAIRLYREQYAGFGPTLASEKMLERDQLTVHDETLRLWLIESGDWEKGRWQRKHRQWRERKECLGEMVQMDGSRHDWLEGRGPELTLMGYIDDATNKVHARFYEYEGTLPAMDSLRGYIQRHGIPQSVYADRHSTYQSSDELTIEEQLVGKEETKTQFGRALEELGVILIAAHSPQAKGRIERLFRTFQDRLIKEMRLRRIKSIEEANEFLEKYLPQYNERFMVEPVKKVNLHREVPKGIDLKRILCIKNERVVRLDNTIRHEGNLYWVDDPWKEGKPKKIMVEERLDGKLYLMDRDRTLRYRLIQEHPKVKKTVQRDLLKPRKIYIPAVDHPWRKPILQPVVSEVKLLQKAA